MYFMQKLKKLITLGLVVLMAAASSACSKTATTKEALSPGGKQEFNGEKVYVRQGGLPDPALFIANQNSETGTNSFGDFTFEGLVRYQRGSDDIELQLAESYTNEGNKTIFKLRPNIKWSDGEIFTSKDIWAFYQICFNSPVNYLTSIETPDDLTVEFVWQEPAPFDDLRIMLIAQEVHHGRIPYHIYKKFADERAELVQQLPLLTKEQKAKGLQGPYGRDTFNNPEIVSKLDDAWKEYIVTPPNKDHIIVGTGPYINDAGHTLNEGSMSKNPYYWNPSKQTYDKIIIKSTTDATKASRMKSEEIQNMDGTLPKDLTDSILASNKNLIYYPMEDMGSHGLYFNQGSKTSPMSKKEFRQALIYIADREAMRDIGSYQSELHPWSSLGLPPSMLTKYVDQEVIDKMRKYDHNEQKAAELLESIGCTKVNGKWLNIDKTPIKLTIGLDKGWYVATLVTPIYANQLKQFGIECEVMAVDGTVYGSQSEVEHAFDMSWEWMDIAWSFSYPYFPLKNYYEHVSGPAKKMNFPFDEKTNVTTLEVTDWDGNTINIWNWLSAMQNEPDEKVRKDHWERIIWATNENAFAINFYQNVTAAWENLNTTGGLPMLDKVPENRWMPFPETEEEKIAAYNLNWGFSGGVRKMWMLSPK
jgi:peptide/nickel transport system substrate-binding protein